jgi:hypothetical protein
MKYLYYICIIKTNIMKKLILIIGIVSSTILFVSCGNSKRVLSNDNNYSEISSNVVVSDSTQEPGYNSRQRAFAYFLMSLPKEDQQKWKSTGSFSEKEVNNLVDTIDYKKRN